MKTKLITLLAFAILLNNYALGQDLFVKQVISTELLNPLGISAADFDNDGDVDVVSISWDYGIISWFNNLGAGTFDHSPQVITEIMTFGYGVITADVDSDGLIDVLGSSSDDKVVWFKNLGGGDFGDVNNNHQLITASANTDSPRGMYAEDLNGDGDIDVLSSSRWDHKIAWYENLGGGDFGNINANQNIITTNALNAQCVYAADLDGDGDMDVISGSAGDAKIAWYENTDGLGTFGPQQIITTDAEGVRSVYAADLDGDLDMDVISASPDDNKIAWYENTDGLGTFGSQQILILYAFGTRSVIAKDFDSDGDIDIIFSSPGNNKIAWFENLDGQGNFSDVILITDDAPGTADIDISDIDNDGDLDVLSANYTSHETTWYEQVVLDVNDNFLIDFSVYPSPTSGIINVQSKTTIVQIEIYNQLGQLILSNKNQNIIDISSVTQGIYFIKIKDESGAFGVQKVVKK